MNDLITICVPIYNVAPWIERCARSLFEQTYSNIEYIFVDDCSPDESMRILRAIASQYPDRATCCHYIRNDINHGPAYTRRVGIEHATGTYITCVDSDDYIPLDAVEKMYRCAIQYDADIVQGQFFLVVQQNTQPSDGHICGNLIRQSIIRHEDFPPEGLNYLEDRWFMTKLYQRTKPYTLEEPVYVYCDYTPSSLSRKKGAYHLECLKRFYEEFDFSDYDKVEAKSNILLHVDNKTRMQYADLYRQEEKMCLHQLRRTNWLMSTIVHYHLWPLMYILDFIIQIKDNLKLRMRRNQSSI